MKTVKLIVDKKLGNKVREMKIAHKKARKKMLNQKFFLQLFSRSCFLSTRHFCLLLWCSNGDGGKKVNVYIKQTVVIPNKFGFASKC